MDIIKQQRGSDLATAVIFDAVASEYTDACFNWLMQFYRQELVRENRIFAQKRISCGYGDFSLSNQKFFYEALQLSVLGIALTPHSMLVPEKSATAIVGITGGEKQ